MPRSNIKMEHNSTEFMAVATRTEQGHSSTSTPVESVKAYLILCQVVDVSLLVMALFIILCMIVYGKKTNKWEATSLDNGKIYTACVVAVALCLPEFILNQTLFYLMDYPNAMKQCELIMDMSDISYYVAVYGMHVFLWMRQRTIYEQPLVKSITSKYMNAVSWTLLATITAIGVLCCVSLFFTAPSSTENGCAKIAEASYWYSTLTELNGGLFTLWELILLSLFVYPMIRIKHARKSIRPEILQQGGSSEEPTGIRKRLASVKSIIFPSVANTDCITMTIYRAIVATIVATISDLTATILIGVVVPPGIPRIVDATIHNISLFVDINCVIATFGSNMRIFTVFCRREDSVERSEMSRRSEEVLMESETPPLRAFSRC